LEQIYLLLEMEKFIPVKKSTRISHSLDFVSLFDSFFLTIQPGPVTPGILVEIKVIGKLTINANIILSLGSTINGLSRSFSPSPK